MGRWEKGDIRYSSSVPLKPTQTFSSYDVVLPRPARPRHNSSGASLHFTRFLQIYDHDNVSMTYGKSWDLSQFNSTSTLSSLQCALSYELFPAMGHESNSKLQSLPSAAGLSSHDHSPHLYILVIKPNPQIKKSKRKKMILISTTKSTTQSEKRRSYRLEHHGIEKGVRSRP